MGSSEVRIILQKYNTTNRKRSSSCSLLTDFEGVSKKPALSYVSYSSENENSSGKSSKDSFDCTSENNNSTLVKGRVKDCHSDETFDEELIESKIENGSRMHLMNWKGRPPKRNSWEPAKRIEKVSKNRNSTSEEEDSDSTDSESGTEASEEEYVEEFEVEQILKRKVEKGLTKFLVKWKNWSDEYNSWEPEEHLANSQEIVKEFMEAFRLKRTSPKNSLLAIKTKKSSIPSKNTSVRKCQKMRKCEKMSLSLDNLTKNSAKKRALSLDSLTENSTKKRALSLDSLTENSTKKRALSLDNLTENSTKKRALSLDNLTENSTKKRAIEKCTKPNSTSTKNTLNISDKEEPLQTSIPDCDTICVFNQYEDEINESAFDANQPGITWPNQVLVSADGRTCYLVGVPEGQETFEVVLKEDLKGEEFEYLYNAVRGVDGCKLCMVKFVGKNYIECVRPEILFQAFPYLENLYSTQALTDTFGNEVWLMCAERIDLTTINDSIAVGPSR